MAQIPRIVGRCPEIKNRQECEGKLIEDLVQRNPRFFASAIIFLLGETKLIGYVCDRCGTKQPLIDPAEFMRYQSR